MSQVILNIFILIFLIGISYSTDQLKHLKSFKQLGQYHCQVFPIELIYRLSSGKLSQIYGIQYGEIDCYIRQFVNKDGQQKINFYDEQQQEQQDNIQQEVIPQIDPILRQYSQGLLKCLPKQINAIEASYSIWRFYRFIIQNDYLYQSLRAKTRSGFGYQAEKPNAYMDGQQLKPRLRLDKLFSNQFYQYTDKLMFKQFLYPLMSFLRKNVIAAIDGKHTLSGNSFLFQVIETRNYMDQVFIPVTIQTQQQQSLIFSYTLPGIPLLFAGSSKQIAWGFSGILVDRSNIEEIQTVGNKFYHDESQQWIKLQRRNITIPVKNVQDGYQCTFMYSAYGTLYEKRNQTGKVKQYISKWHQDQPRIRNVFSGVYHLIRNHGVINVSKLQFPFISLLITNKSGIFNYLCPQKYPSYFLYADMPGEPETVHDRWIPHTKKGFAVMANTHLATVNLSNYVKRQIMSPLQQQYITELKKLIKNKENFAFENFYQTISKIQTNPQIKKIKDLLIYIYRKAKFVYFPQEKYRKQCDQLISMLDKWDNKMDSVYSPVYTLWSYFFKKYTYNYISYSNLAKDLLRYRVLTDVYWVNQIQLWKIGTSYGECQSNQWKQVEEIVNGTGLNSTCFYNIMRSINKTRQILINSNNQYNIQKLNPINYQGKNILKLSFVNNDLNLIGSDIQEAFGNYYSKNIAFGAEIGSGNIIYSRGYNQKVNYITLKSKTIQNEQL